MPLFISQPTPWVVGTPQDFSQAGFTALTANTAYLLGTTLYTPVVLTGLRTRFSTAGNGHYDLAVYDSGWNGSTGTSNRLVSIGSTVTAAGVQTTTLGTPLTLAAGRYWLAFWIDNATDTVPTAQYGTGTFPCQSKGSVSTNLPSTITTLSNQSFCPYVTMLFQGLWS